MKEVWKDIEEYESLYQVSNQGRVRSLDRTVINNGSIRLIEGKLLKPINNGFGYLYINLCKDSKIKRTAIHRLVAKTFLPNPDNLAQVNHKNEIKSDNRVENLEWCNSKYNANYGNRNAKCTESKRNKYGKIVKQYDINGNLINIMYMGDAIKIKKIYYANLIKCCKGKQKTAGGYIWRYADE